MVYCLRIILNCSIHFYFIQTGICFLPDNRHANYLIGTAITCSILLFAIICAIIAMHHSFNVEKQDELSKLHKYKAGYISKYITLFGLFIVIWFFKDYSFAYTSDIFEKISPIIIIYAFSQLAENLTFIVLEKM